VMLGSHLGSDSQQALALGFHDGMMEETIGDVVYLDTCLRQDVLDYYLETIVRSPVRGVAVCLPLLPRVRLRQLAESLTAQDIPCVFIHNALREPPAGSATIYVDGHRAAALATEILWQRGHRNIVAIEMDGIMGQRARVAGYVDTMRAYGGTPRVKQSMSPSPDLRPAAPVDRPSLRDVADLAVASGEASAILALSSSATLEVMRAFHVRGLRPPSDGSVMALGCWDWMHFVASPPISHVTLPYYEAGREASRLLLTLTGDRSAGIERTVSLEPGDEALHCVDNGTVATVPVAAS
ncbi:MAG: substrate-binding domain-containing protein, partial [Chloroflexi bacterium]|nr:substrate-binding domain-containing protein [Chloroflexota bacterium]